MIAYLRGLILRAESDRVIVRLGGIGYEVFVSALTLPQLGHGNEHTFWIYTAVSENAIDLYGFLTYRDKQLFELLISVQGMGLKSGMRMLSAMEGRSIAQAISDGDVVSLTTIQGIGDKTAKNLIRELANRMEPLLSEVEG